MFPTKKYYQVIFVFSSGLFPVFTRQIACYHPHKNRKTYSEEILKSDPSKIQTGCKALKALHN
ncbi:MAG TPA: hypothetical protein DDY73_12965 [Coprobacter fastidiosus]|uniref:Uncharacterized protein n=1 Tax=Coprobacter fastidiosus TaxID=1099853 RepID=A0A316R352_9BACT|nr:MAG: hypothetical protein DBY02_07950 [Coprobacter fastidiosus]RHO54036.1 hypothetical protein DW107_10845 [Tannerella sp. AM09-19]RHS48274.1 hypothetical protein DWV37_04210 [Tannerella sp. AF04-6]HBJ09900.1 hypothetical protein [Coprobacter fastidiosus]